MKREFISLFKEPTLVFETLCLFCKNCPICVRVFCKTVLPKAEQKNVLHKAELVCRDLFWSSICLSNTLMDVGILCKIVLFPLLFFNPMSLLQHFPICVRVFCKKVLQNCPFLQGDLLEEPTLVCQTHLRM